MSDQRKNGPHHLAIVIMAAGKGTRLKSRRPKVLHEIGGKPLLAHVIAAASQIVPVKDIYAIIGHQADSVQIKDYEHILVLSGDVPLIQAATIADLRDFHLAKNAAMTILTAEPPDPADYGRVLRATASGDRVKAIVEKKDLTRAQQKTREINSGIYGFAVKPLLEKLDKLTTHNAQGEFYLTDMAAILVSAGKRVLALKAGDPAEVLGANTLAELAALDSLLRARKCNELMDSGVVIYKPETCVIDSDVQIAADTVIEPFVQVLGKTTIGADCRIRSYSIISDSTIGDRVQVRPGCVIDHSEIADEVLLGPYSHLRPGSDIGQGAHVGNFVETKKIKLGRGSKANHLTYLGDAKIGEGVNIGAGTITCNYDGVEKHVTVIEDGAFIGSDSTLVAPVRIGKGAYVAAGSSITHDVPDDALAFGRARQEIKEGWAKDRRETARKK